MNWINEYKNKAKTMKLLGVLSLSGTFLVEVIVWAVIGVFSVISVIILWIGLFIAIVCLMCKVVYRKYNDNYICLYFAPLKNYLIINDEIQYEGGPFTYHYYGQLQDGIDITVKVGLFRDVKFAIGGFNNFNHSAF